MTRRSFAVNGPATWPHWEPLRGHWRRTCSRRLGAIETSAWFWRRI